MNHRSDNLGSIILYLVVAFTQIFTHAAANFVSNNTCCNKFLSARIQILCYSESRRKNDGCLEKYQPFSRI